jgi:hypothetical protein
MSMMMMAIFVVMTVVAMVSAMTTTFFMAFEIVNVFGFYGIFICSYGFGLNW